MYQTNQEEIGKVVETLKTLEQAIGTGKINDTLVRTIILSVINDLELPPTEQESFDQLNNMIWQMVLT